MDRRKFFFGLPLAALAASVAAAAQKPIPGSSGEILPASQPVRILYVPKGLLQETHERIRAAFTAALDSGKIILLEEGFEYREYYGGPGEVAVREDFKTTIQVDAQGLDHMLTEHADIFRRHIRSQLLRDRPW